MNNINSIINEITKYKLLNDDFRGVDAEDLSLLFIRYHSEFSELMILNKKSNLLNLFGIKVTEENLEKLKFIIKEGIR